MEHINIKKLWELYFAKIGGPGTASVCSDTYDENSPTADSSITLPQSSLSDSLPTQDASDACTSTVHITETSTIGPIPEATNFDVIPDLSPAAESSVTFSSTAHLPQATASIIVPDLDVSLTAERSVNTTISSTAPLPPATTSTSTVMPDISVAIGSSLNTSNSMVMYTVDVRIVKVVELSLAKNVSFV